MNFKIIFLTSIATVLSGCATLEKHLDQASQKLLDKALHHNSFCKETSKSHSKTKEQESWNREVNESKTQEHWQRTEKTHSNKVTIKVGC